MTSEIWQKTWHAWMKQNYFGIIAEVVAGSCDSRGSAEIAASSSDSQGSSGQTSATAAVTDVDSGSSSRKKSAAQFACGNMFGSPKKKARRTMIHDPDAKTEFKDVQDLHTMELPQAGPLSMEAMVLHNPPECRLVNVPNKLTGGKDRVFVVSVLLADRSGPVALEAWREHAEKLVRDFAMWSKQTSGPVLVQVHHFDVREDNRPHTGAMRKMHSNDCTKVTRVDVPERDSMTNEAIIPHPSLYTRDFDRLDMKPTFLVNVAGIVSMVQDETYSVNGDPMRQFRLSDSGGKYVSCRVFGRHTENDSIENGADVVLYFAAAQAGKSNQQSQLWIYDEAHIVLLKKGCGIPSPRQNIEFKGV